MSAPTKILIVDDHVILREGLASLLDQQPDWEVVGEAGSVSEAIDKANKLEPDIVLMDIGLPDGSGVDATRAILHRHPEMKIVMLTIHETDELLLAAIRSGAMGYLVKNTPVTKLIASLQALRRGEAAISRKMTKRLLVGLASENASSKEKDETIHVLTPREMEVLREIATGATNLEIAKRLFISVNTVKNHVHKILEKLELNNRREATLFAIRYGLDKPFLK